METLKNHVATEYDGNVSAAARALGYHRQALAIMVKHGGYHIADNKIFKLVKDLSPVVNMVI